MLLDDVEAHHATQMFDLLDCAESRQVFQRRLPKHAVYTSQQQVRWSLPGLLGNYEHTAADNVGSLKTDTVRSTASNSAVERSARGL